MNILFVCTGNSCRSVMAAYYLKKLAADLKIKNVEVHSAGTATVAGITASSETVKVLKEENIDVKGHRATSLSRELIKRSDIIFAMTNGHLYDILHKYPEAKDKIFLLAGDDIFDPIGGSAETYRKCLTIIKKSINQNLLPKITG